VRETNRVKKGKYEVNEHSHGGFTVHGKWMRPKGYYVPPDDQLKKKYRQQLKEHGRIQQGLTTQLSYRGVLAIGKRSVPEGRKALGLNSKMETKEGTFNRGPVSREEIMNAIRSFWPKKEVERALQGEKVRLPNIEDFSEMHQRQYHSAHRNPVHRGFRKIIEAVYPGLYAKIRGEEFSVDPETVDEDQVRRTLLERHERGLPISKTQLRNSQDPLDRLLAREVMALDKRQHPLFSNQSSNRSKKGKKRRKQYDTHASIVHSLTGLEKRDIELHGAARKTMGTITEELTHVFFKWARVVGMELPSFVRKGKVHRNGSETRFYYGANDGIADLRIGNQPVECKAGVSGITSDVMNNLINKYTPSGSGWSTGEPFRDSMAIFHTRPEFYKKYLDVLELARINVVHYREFHGWLRELVKVMKANYQDEIKSMQPRVHNLDHLVKLHEEISLGPHVIMRTGNRERREWSKIILKALAEKADDLGGDPLESIQDRVGGGVMHYAGGQFLMIQRDLSQINAGELGEYLKNNIGQLTANSISDKFPQFKRVAKKRMLFWDIETGGLKWTDPICTISMCKIAPQEPKIRSTCLVARDYSEERPMIAYFREQLHNHHAFFTYNGNSFDLPRLSERAKQNGVMMNGEKYKGLRETLGTENVDLYHIARRNLVSKLKDDAKLQTAEKRLFGFQRTGDVPGIKVPPAYRRYVNGETGVDNDGDTPVDKMEKIIEHNMLDTVSLAAILTYICSE